MTHSKPREEQWPEDQIDGFGLGFLELDAEQIQSRREPAHIPGDHEGKESDIEKCNVLFPLRPS